MFLLLGLRLLPIASFSTFTPYLPARGGLPEAEQAPKVRHDMDMAPGGTVSCCMPPGASAPRSTTASIRRHAAPSTTRSAHSIPKRPSQPRPPDFFMPIAQLCGTHDRIDLNRGSQSMRSSLAYPWWCGDLVECLPLPGGRSVQANFTPSKALRNEPCCRKHSAALGSYNKKDWSRPPKHNP